MSRRSRKLVQSRMARWQLQNAIAVLVLLPAFLVLFDSNLVRPVNGQFEAVGAVLSVVPVTSILATAGLVGVKLAALSRLLQVLGYDQAYLASGGAGTASQPIGLQTDYSYMFPYVPGLNISVKGEHASPSYQGPSSSVVQKEASHTAVTRKTYPAMGIPGDYENQRRPFRGADTLKEIFRNAGLRVQFSNQNQVEQQQQQFQQQQQQVMPEPAKLKGKDSLQQNYSPSASIPTAGASASASSILMASTPARVPLPATPSLVTASVPASLLAPIPASIPTPVHVSATAPVSNNMHAPTMTTAYKPLTSPTFVSPQEYHPIPQHEYFYRKWLESRRTSLPSGQLTHVPEGGASTFEDYDKIVHSDTPTNISPFFDVPFHDE